MGWQGGQAHPIKGCSEMPRQQPLARARSLPTPAACHHPEGVRTEAGAIKPTPMQPAAMVQGDWMGT